MTRSNWWLWAVCGAVGLLCVSALCGTWILCKWPEKIVPHLSPPIALGLSSWGNDQTRTMIRVRLREPDAEALILEELGKGEKNQLRMCLLLDDSPIDPLPEVVRIQVYRLANASDPAVRTAARQILQHGQAFDWLARQIRSENSSQSYAETGYSYHARQALALWAFCGAGYDHKAPSKYKKTIKNIVDSLLQAQNENGTFSNDPSENALIVCALSEAYGMTADKLLLPPLQQAMVGLRHAWSSNAYDLWFQDSQLAMNQAFAWISLYAGGVGATSELQELKEGFAHLLASAAPHDESFPWFVQGKSTDMHASQSFDAAQCAGILLGKKVPANPSSTPPLHGVQSLHGYWWTFSLVQNNKWKVVREQWNMLKDTQFYGYQNENDGSWTPTSPDQDRFIITVFSVLNQEFYYRSGVVLKK